MWILASFAPLAADEPPPASAPNAAPLPDNSAVPGDSQGPANSQVTANSPAANAPLLPQQAGSPYPPLSTSATNPQSPQITAPNFYTTGGNNVSQIATNSALTQAFSPQASSGFLSEPGVDYSHGPIDRIRLGPLDLRTALFTSAVADDNLRTGSAGGGKEGDTSFNITPAILLEYGTHDGQKGYASLVYAPTITRFLHQSDEDTDDQNVALTAMYPFQKLTLNVSQTFAQVTGIDQDTNLRTTQSSSLTTFGGNYALDDKLVFSSNLQESITSFSEPGAQGQAVGEGDTTSSLNSSLSYKLSEKMLLNSSINVGLDKPENAKQETFEQGLLGLTYQPTEKISLFAQGGAEIRQGGENNGGGQGGDETNPIFSVGVAYTPFDSTAFSVNAYQDVRSSSANSGQTVVDTGVSCAATQRFLQRFYLNLNFSYSHNDDQSGTGAGSATGGDSQDNRAYGTSLSYAPTAWTSVALYYRYVDNESDAPGGNYHDNQVGISISARF